ncbi:CRISPR-associated endonuclease Cas1 [Protofrankia symbiont of Coriaria ruscifolia]|uniref:CRISPR-associated endonuclease Cas1 n=1 Tax=Protofrankia symbiont of Coriaria ruscifolia TaxID=1306542 RepID=UPI0010410D1C|nr:CRISPR-associated endonuclease Cas1 [Protofrankia symbiont of Coriaria ruscifolia]
MAMITRQPLYVVGHGSVLSKRGGRLVISRDGQVITSAPLSLVAEVVLLGNVTVTTPTMNALLADSVPLVLLTDDGRARGRLEPPSAPHIDVRRQQLARSGDESARLELARAVVRGKIHNQDILLRRRAARSTDPDEVWALAHRLAELANLVDDAPTLSTLLGVEGAAAGAYFRGIRLLLDDTAAAGFRRRDRSDVDIVNVLVNYCSALLREVVMGAVVAAGLDPYLSFLHTPSRGRPALVFDLMEEWRPILLESTVLALLGLGIANSDHVTVTPDGPRLAPEVTSAAINRFRARMAAPARGWPKGAESGSYADRLRGQSREFRGWVLGESEAYQPFVWR